MRQTAVDRHVVKAMPLWGHGNFPTLHIFTDGTRDHMKADFYNYYEAILAARGNPEGDEAFGTVPHDGTSLGDIVSILAVRPGFGKPGFEGLVYVNGVHDSKEKGRFLIQITVSEATCTNFRIWYEKDFGRDPATGELLEPTNDPEVLPVQQILLTSLLMYRHYRQECFVIDSFMEKALSETPISNVPEKYFRLPYRAFYVALPDTQSIAADEHLLYGHGDTGRNSAIGALPTTDPEKRLGTGIFQPEDTGYHKLGGFFVTEHGDFLSLLIVGRPNEKSVNESDVPTTQLTLCLKHIKWGTPNAITDYVEWVLSSHDNQANDAGIPYAPTSSYQYARMKASLHHCVKLLVNLILYANSTNPDFTRSNATNSKHVRSLKKKLRKSKLSRAKRLGPKILKATKCSIIMVGNSYEARATRNTMTTGKAVSGHFRKAHWHTYHVGPRLYEDGTKIPLHLQDSKLLWVDMTEINPDSDDQIEKRTYVVSAAADMLDDAESME